MEDAQRHLHLVDNPSTSREGTQNVFSSDQTGKEPDAPVSFTSAITNQATTVPRRNYKWWLRISIYTVCLLFGQSSAILLGRLYFAKGGSSKWLASLMQLVGFPILIPYYFTAPAHKNQSKDDLCDKPPSAIILGLAYGSLGLLMAAVSFLYSIGQQYLPLTTLALISASQIAFNSLFSFFLNSQKFTPFIVNSLVLLTISTVLPAFSHASSNQTAGISKGKVAAGFISTVAASACYGLMLASTQLCFKKVIKRQSFKTVMDMTIYQQIVATAAIAVGLFASGEWKDLTKEMNEYELGKVSYVATLVWTAVVWQVFSIGCVGLIFEVSSLFCNVISFLGSPIVPILAVIIFHDKLDGIKAISMVLGAWGFLSYIYQHYLDDYSSNADNDRNIKSTEISKASPTSEV